MLPTQLLWLCNPIEHAFQVPALCKVRKGRDTHYVFGARFPPFGGVAHLLMMSVRAIGAEGAPSLRFLQGRVTMQPTQLLWLCNPVTHAFQIPALCKKAQRTGHPLYLLRQRGQKPRPPAYAAAAREQTRTSSLACVELATLNDSSGSIVPPNTLLRPSRD